MLIRVLASFILNTMIYYGKAFRLNFFKCITGPLMSLRCKKTLFMSEKSSADHLKTLQAEKGAFCVSIRDILEFLILLVKQTLPCACVLLYQWGVASRNSLIKYFLHFNWIKYARSGD